MKYFKIYLLILGCSLLPACGKKEKISLTVHEGTWKPVRFIYREYPRNHSYDLRYSLLSGSILCCESFPVSPHVAETTHTYELQYSVETFLRDNAILVIDEHYTALDSLGHVARTFAYKKELTLVEGKKEYDGIFISDDTMKINLMDASGIIIRSQFTELVRVR